VNFVCTGCGASDVATRDQFSEAMEYRRLDSRERLHRRTTRLLCRACVVEIRASGRPDQQAFTFGDAP